MQKQAKAPSAGSRFYRQIGAHGWCESDWFTYSSSSSPLRRWIADQIGAPPSLILSVGCGSGELESHLGKLGHRMVG
ncbi:MAG: hypothetical protein LAP21_15440, partial [Acidobacteriia bacterium]|nr:hypothetical protein [Terriglobia bacterium]